MTPEKLQGWIYKVIPGGRTLRVVHEQALGQGLTIASWTREEVDGSKAANLNHAEQVLDEAQFHADSVGEACRFLIQWCSESDKPLRTMIHRAAPSEGSVNQFAAGADLVSPNAMVGQLLSHIHDQQKVLNGSIGVVLSAYDRAMNMQGEMLKQMGTMLQAQRKQLAEQVDSPEVLELTRAKTRAFDKLVDGIPDVLKFAITALVPENNAGDASSASSTNGVEQKAS
jgi:hypothetical protein